MEAAFVSRIAQRHFCLFGTCAYRAPCWLLLLALIGSISIGKQVTQDQDQDRQRKIVSDDFTKSRKQTVRHGSTARSRVGAKARRTYRLVPNTASGPRALPAGNFMQLGITIWRLRPARKDDFDRALIREKRNTAVWAAERMASDAAFQEGDFVRLSVESPRRGYLYVIDRDLSADGTTGEPMLIFPWAGADNRLAPGRLIDIPAQDDDPSYFKTSLTRDNQVGELLTFIVSSTPLDLPVSDKPVSISGNDLSQWEKALGGVTERYDMEGGAGELWTRNEQQAARKDRRRQLTRNDPAPQTIYRVYTANKKGLLVNLVLKYGK